MFSIAQVNPIALLCGVVSIKRQQVMTLSDFNLKTYDNYKFALEYGHQMKPRIFCIDGFNMSVQGSSGHYCSPRSLEKDYYSMEIGYPSAIEETLLPFAEDKESPLETVYGYVDCDIIEAIIQKHGGIDVVKTFQ